MHILKYYTFPNLINLNKKTNRRHLLKKNINYLIVLRKCLFDISYIVINTNKSNVELCKHIKKCGKH